MEAPVWIAVKFMPLRFVPKGTETSIMVELGAMTPSADTGLVMANRIMSFPLVSIVTGI
jgi:hypothetical protein